MESPPKAEQPPEMEHRADPRDVITESMIEAGALRLRALLRGDTMIQDHSGRTLRMVVREIWIAMAKANNL